MAMKTLREGASGGITKIILFGFMTMAVGGLVMMDVGGFFRGGITNTDVAKIGDTTISMRYFDQAVRRTLRPIGVTPEQAYQMGYTNQILNNEIRDILITNAAHDHNIAIGDETVKARLKEMVEPLTISSGQSAKDVLNQVLRAQGMSEADLVNSIARDTQKELFMNAIAAPGNAITDAVAMDLYRHNQETRTLNYIAFLDDEIQDIAAPDDDTLRQIYNDTKARFIVPERRILRVAMLDMASLEETLEIPDELLLETYKDNIDHYRTDASWTIKQALVTSADKAQQIYDVAKKGPVLKDAVKKVTGKETDYLGQQSMTQDGLLEELKAPISAATEAGTLLPPVKSPLGWHIVLVKDIQPAQIKPFEDVKKGLKQDLMHEQLIDQQYEIANMVDDLLAGGATLDEVSSQIKLNITTTAAIDASGMDSAAQNALTNFKDAQNLILENGFILGEGETSPVLETQEGDMFVVEANSITPQSYLSFEEAKDDIRSAWIAREKRLENREKIAGYLKNITENKLSLKDVAKSYNRFYRTIEAISRRHVLEEPLSQHSLSNIFEAPIAQPFLLDIENGYAIAEVPSYIWPNVSAEDKAFAAFKESLQQGARDETLMFYLAHLQRKYGVSVNQKLLDQIYAPAQNDF